jgi:plastocyanin
MSKSPALSNIRIIPRETEYLDRKLGARGEVFFDQAGNTLRLYDGQTSGGIALLKADLSNLEGQISSVILSDTPPTNVESGTIWVDTTTLKLYVYYSDGSGTQWVQPTTPSYGSGGGTGGATAVVDLTDVTISNPTSGQVLKYNGTKWVNGTDNVGGGSGSGATVLDELTDVVVSSPAANQVLKYNGSTWVNSAEASAFSSIVVANQSNIVSTTPSGSLTFKAGTGISITTNNTNGTLEIHNEYAIDSWADISDIAAAGLTVDKVYLPAITRLVVTNRLTAAYLFDQYTGDNPSIYAISGTTIAFNLQATSHPFQIQSPTGVNYNTGLIHVSTTGVVSTGASAQGKDSGTLYWKVPADISGGYRYQCSAHGSMVGSLTVKSFAGL